MCYWRRKTREWRGTHPVAHWTHFSQVLGVSSPSGALQQHRLASCLCSFSVLLLSYQSLTHSHLPKLCWCPLSSRLSTTSFLVLMGLSHSLIHSFTVIFWGFGREHGFKPLCVTGSLGEVWVKNIEHWSGSDLAQSLHWKALQIKKKDLPTLTCPFISEAAESQSPEQIGWDVPVWDWPALSRGDTRTGLQCLCCWEGGSPHTDSQRRPSLAGCDRRGDGLLPKRKTWSLSPGDETTSWVTCPLRSPPTHTRTLPAVTASKCRGGKRDKGHCHLQSRLTTGPAGFETAFHVSVFFLWIEVWDLLAFCFSSVSQCQEGSPPSSHTPWFHWHIPNWWAHQWGHQGREHAGPPQRTEGQALLQESGPPRPKSPLGQGPNTPPS